MHGRLNRNAILFTMQHPRPDGPPCPDPRRPARPPARPCRRGAWVFGLVHKLLTGGAALAALLRLLF